ncbi:MAG: hypothetical protein ABFD18_06445 [Syntrophomonas sp.]
MNDNVAEFTSMDSGQALHLRQFIMQQQSQDKIAHLDMRSEEIRETEKLELMQRTMDIIGRATAALAVVAIIVTIAAQAVIRWVG